MKKLLILLVPLLLAACQNSSSDEGEEIETTAETYKSTFLEVENGTFNEWGEATPARHIHSDIILAIRGDEAKLSIQSRITQGENTSSETVTATGKAASSKFNVTTNDTVYTCTRQDAKTIHLEMTKPIYHDYNTLDRQ